MAVQIKLISDTSDKEVESKVNKVLFDWGNAIKVLDIKFAVNMDCASAMIIYEEVNE